ncbi:DUF481 domain-containing protein [Motilimonas pumila]|nr:DUF481 domain-containing protein [Motilimonas pumila]
MHKRYLSLAIAILVSGHIQAGDFAVTVGALHNTADTNISMGVPALGAQLKLDGESDLDLAKKRYSPYVKLEYQIDNKHSVFLDWHALHRRTQAQFSSAPVNVLDRQVEVGVNVDLALDIDIARVGYAYTFLTTDKLRLDAMAGLHVMTIKSQGGIDARVAVDGQESVSVAGKAKKNNTMPLPNVGVRASYQLTPKLAVKSHLQAFMVSTRLYDGHLLDFNLGAQYQVTDALSVNAAYNHYGISVDYGDSLLDANIKMSFSGPMLSLQYGF